MTYSHALLCSYEPSKPGWYLSVHTSPTNIHYHFPLWNHLWILLAHHTNKPFCSQPNLKFIKFIKAIAQTKEASQPATPPKITLQNMSHKTATGRDGSLGTTSTLCRAMCSYLSGLSVPVTLPALASSITTFSFPPLAPLWKEHVSILSGKTKTFTNLMPSIDKKTISGSSQPNLTNL